MNKPLTVNEQTSPIVEKKEWHKVIEQAETPPASVAEPVPDDVKKPSVLMELFRKYASLSDLLRYGGALSVAVAMALFLMEGAQALNDIERFLTMLGFTGALTGAGFLMSLLLKEQRGSRVFIALALLSVPVNFTVFGALIYSFVPLDGMAMNYPGFAQWQAAGTTDLALAIAAGIAVLMPVVWAGFTVLARTERRWMSGALLLSSATLVVPVRHEVIVAIIAVLAVSASLWILRRYNRDSLALKTVEGRFAKTLLFIAPLIIVARSLFLYEASGVVLLMLSGGSYFAVRQLLNSRTGASWFTSAATLFASLMTYAVSASVFGLGEGFFKSEPAVVIATCVFLVVNCDLARVSPNRKLAGTLGIFSVVLATILLVALALFEGGTLMVSICVALLVVVAVTGYRLSYPASSVIAMAGIAAIGVTYVESLWSMALGTGWWGIAALGVVAIVAGSLVDRAGIVVKPAEA